jgi:hypothetical protein
MRGAQDLTKQHITVSLGFKLRGFISYPALGQLEQGSSFYDILQLQNVQK